MRNAGFFYSRMFIALDLMMRKTCFPTFNSKLLWASRDILVNNGLPANVPTKTPFSTSSKELIVPSRIFLALIPFGRSVAIKMSVARMETNSLEETGLSTWGIKIVLLPSLQTLNPLWGR